MHSITGIMPKQVFSVQNGRPILGAYIASTHDIADNAGCPVLTPAVGEAVDIVADEVYGRKLRVHWKERPVYVISRFEVRV